MSKVITTQDSGSQNTLLDDSKQAAPKAGAQGNESAPGDMRTEVGAGQTRVAPITRSEGTLGSNRLHASAASGDVVGRDAGESYPVAGTVYWYGTQERAIRAVVHATSSNDTITLAQTDDDGNFAFPTLQAGTWTFVAFHPEQDGRPRPLKDQQINAARGNLFLEVYQATGTVDEHGGRAFFRWLCILMIVLVVGYIFTHVIFQPPDEPLSPTLTAKIARAREQLAAAAQPGVSMNLAATMTEIRTDFASLIEGNPDRLAPIDTDEIYDRLTAASNFIAVNKRDEALKQLDALRSRIQQPTARGFFWNREPWRFVEVLLWGLAGTIASLMMTTARYMRRNMFYREGLFFH